jgi:hypothetical protein
VNYLAEPLGEHHDLASFDCGHDELNDWLRLHARTATGQGTRTYVLIGNDGAVVGYFAIAPHTVDREQLSRSQGRGAPRQIPAVLLAKLALDRRLQGQRLGSELLVVALRTRVATLRTCRGRNRAPGTPGVPICLGPRPSGVGIWCARYVRVGPGDNSSAPGTSERMRVR